MSHQSVVVSLNEKKAPGPSPVQSSSGICIKQEYFEDQLLMTQTIKTESESAPNEHNIMQSIKVEVKEEHYDDQDCVVKCELDFDEGEQINRKIKVEVEDVSSGQLVQHFKCVKKEEDEDGGEYVMECDCEDCETCRVKMEMKEELDESGETELGGNSGEAGQGFTRVKKEEGEDDGEVERPYKIPRMDRVVGNVPIWTPSPSPTVYSPNIVSTNVEGLDDQMATSSTNSFTIEDHTQPSQPVTVPSSVSIVTPTQPSSSSSAQHVNESLRDELLNAEPMMGNVALVIDVRSNEYDREQIDHDDEDDGDQSIEQRQDASAVCAPQFLTVNFVKRIEPADELGNRFECDYQQCGRRMKAKQHLIDHIRTHTGEKPFKCSVPGCERAFVRKAQLNTSPSTLEPVLLFAVGLDMKLDLGNKSNLTAHLRTHTGERPFECTWPNCGQAFTRSNHLKTHSLAHSNERQFVCDVTGCTKVYKHKNALLRHQMTKHN